MQAADVFPEILLTGAEYIKSSSKGLRFNFVSGDKKVFIPIPNGTDQFDIANHCFLGDCVPVEHIIPEGTLAPFCVACVNMFCKTQRYFKVFNSVFCPEHLPTANPIIRKCVDCNKDEFFHGDFITPKKPFRCNGCMSKLIVGAWGEEKLPHLKQCDCCPNTDKYPCLRFKDYVMCYQCIPYSDKWVGFVRRCGTCGDVGNSYDCLGPLNFTCRFCIEKGVKPLNEKPKIKVSVVASSAKIGPDARISNINVGVSSTTIPETPDTEDGRAKRDRMVELAANFHRKAMENVKEADIIGIGGDCQGTIANCSAGVSGLHFVSKKQNTP